MALKRKRPVHRQEDSNKRHKFESFSERIDKLSIDVLRKVRPVIPESGADDDDSYVFSFFSESIKKWRDLNLSAAFTEFYRRVLPLSESLPQVVHHKEAIMTLLEEYIARQDELALISLLDMLVQLARDLGEDFYINYWERSVTLLSQTVKHTDFSVIEAAFNTLSWLLKYLARPLVTNLPCTFQQFAPLLGKVPQKQYIRRFASEAFAFLLRRVKDQAEIVQTMLADIEDNEIYAEGITNVFIESMKAPSRSLHSKAVVLFTTLVQNTKDGASQLARAVPRQVLDQVLYNTSKEHFSPILDTVVEFTNSDHQEIAIDLLLQCCIFKDGARIKNWSALVSPLAEVISTGGLNSEGKCLLAATLVANADPITSKLVTRKVFEISQRIPQEQVGAFCEIVGDLNEAVFGQFVLEEFAKYVNKSPKERFESIALTMVALKQRGLLTAPTAIQKDGNGRLNGAIIKKQSAFLGTLCDRLSHETKVPTTNQEAVVLWRDLQLFELLGVRSLELRNQFNELLLRILECKVPLPTITGLLLSLVAEGDLPSNVDEILQILGCQMEFLALDLAFLDGLEKFISKLPTILGPPEESSLQKLYDTLISNLSKPSHLIRSSSLRIHRQLSSKLDASSFEVVAVLLEIENTPRTVENIRSTSVAMRRLPLLFPKEKDEVLISFCFGLLSVNFAPLWNDSCSVLKSVAERSGAKLWAAAFSRLTGLEASESVDDNKEVAAETLPSASLNARSHKVWTDGQLDVIRRLQSLYEKELARTAPEGHTSAQSQSLRALLEFPHLAEQHSRELVPLFLSLELPTEGSPGWPRKDRISLLNLFTKFTNPKALYRTTEVRSTLYMLLQNGDQKIQTLALDAILTWKDVELTTYRENLHNLLDEKKFREELTSLVHVDSDESPIQEEHRQGLMEVVMRILFGNALVRHGSGEGKRSAILAALANVRPEERKVFIDLTLLPFSEMRNVIIKTQDEYHLDKDLLSRFVDERKMMGFVSMILNLVKALGSGIAPYLDNILEALIVCMWKSRLTSNVEVDADDEADAEFAFEEGSTKVARAIRKTSMKVLIVLISTCQTFEWDPYISLIFQELVAGKLDDLPDENIQSPSTRLQFFATLAKYPKTVLSLSRCDENIIPTILKCIEYRNANPSVFETVLGSLVAILKFSQDSNIGESVTKEMILPYLNHILDHITLILATDNFQFIVNSKQTLDHIIEVLRLSAPFVKTAMHAEHLIEPLISLLEKPGRLVNEKIKCGILESVVDLLPLCSDFRPGEKAFDHRLLALSGLFGTLGHRHARRILCQAIELFAEADSSLAMVGTLVGDLNAYSTRRVDLPDFDRRLAAFTILNEQLHDSLTPRAWAPLVYNMLYFVQDTEEMSLRTGAAFSLQRFFSAAQSSDLSSDFTQLLSCAVFPAVKKGLKHSNELVRREFIGVLDSLIKHCGEWPVISDLQVLLGDGDEEANFFNNIYHIQQHRQLRAIMRLSKAASDRVLKPANIEQIFIPLLEKFSLDGNVETHNVAAEAIRGLGSLSAALGWKSYRQLVKRYLSMLKVGDEKERAVVRTICAVVEMAGKVAEARRRRVSDDVSTADFSNEKDVNATSDDDFLTRAVVNEFYPPMLRYLHHHEESSIALRVPVAIALVKVLQVLPEQILVSKLPAVLTDVCHILKSRSQEARDTCRKTLNEIMNLLGPRYFSFILKELKAALTRGYQLHVLGYTMHSILTHLPAKVGDLDACVKDTVDILIDDIFGVTGSEKESEGYTSAMKEVKKNKSYDSFEILAGITSIEKMETFLLPLTNFLYEIGSVKAERKLNEVLRRIQLGVMRNNDSDSTQILDFCVSLFKKIQSQALTVDQPKSEGVIGHFIVDLKFRKTYRVNHFKENAPKLLRFALDTISALLRKYEYLLRDVKVAGLVPVLGDCLLSNVDELRIPSLRLLGRMISLPIQPIEDGTEVFVDRAVQFVKESPVTKSELCQASLKFLSLLIRDRKTFDPPENTLVYLLERIRPDLEEPDRQGVSFSLIRAILSRRIVINEVYDIMAVVANILVTNQSRSVRDTTRALYLQFLMDYPQGRDRLKKQISFLVKNLQYDHESGRQSVMEVLHQVVTKFGDELLQPMLLDLFIGVLLPLSNDESVTCREMASKLMESVIENADDERAKSIRTMLRLWTEQKDKPALLKSSLYVYRVMLDDGKRSTDDIELCLASVIEIIGQSIEGNASRIMWEVKEQALELLIKLSVIDAGRVFSHKQEELWNNVRTLMICEHVGVGLAASKLVGILFSRAESLSDGQVQLNGLYIRVPGLTAIARHSLEQIKNPNSTSELRLQALKNLIFLGRHFYDTKCSLPQKKDAEPDGDPEVISCLSWLVSRVAAEIRYERAVAEYIGLTRKLFVQWMVAMINILRTEDLLTHAKPIIASLSRFTEDGPVASILKSSLKDTREIAEEGLKLMQNKLGTTAYLGQMNGVRQRVMGKRNDRKIKRSIEVVTDPEKAAKKKIRQHEKAKESRKRKVEEFRKKRLAFGK